MTETKKHPGGRPTDYRPEFCKKVDDYLAEREDSREIVGEHQGGRNVYSNKIKVKLPTIEGFAAFLDVNKTTLYEWEEKYPEFSNALDKIRVEQQTRLIDNGLSGDYNATIAKLVLSANHNMREKTDNEQRISGGLSLSGLYEAGQQ